MRRLLAALLLVSLVSVSCGVPLDNQPEVIASEDLPRSLQPDTATSTAVTSLPPQESVSVAIYLVDPADGTPRLVPVNRQVPQGGTRTETERATLELLFAGPTAEESDLTNFVIPAAPDEPITIVDLQHPTPGQVDLVLSESSVIEGGDRVTSFAQIVYTLTNFPNTSMVSFLVLNSDGVPQAIPVRTDTEEGDVTRPVGRDDYATFAVDIGDQES